MIFFYQGADGQFRPAPTPSRSRSATATPKCTQCPPTRRRVSRGRTTWESRRRSAYPSLLVEPNNTGAVSNDLAVHDGAAEALGVGLANHAADLGVPWLVPVFPSAYAADLHPLSRPRHAVPTTPGLERIDLQLIAMMADARRRLAERDLTVGPRALLDGFSASGAFVHRFAALHPELVQAAATGSGAGWPLAPVAEWDGIPLRYPVGIADLAALVGKPFAAASYRRVPLFVYVGDDDENDPVPGWDPIDRDAVFALTGVSSGPIWPRWPVSQEIHEGTAMRGAVRGLSRRRPCRQQRHAQRRQCVFRRRDARAGWRTRCRSRPRRVGLARRAVAGASRAAVAGAVAPSIGGCQADLGILDPRASPGIELRTKAARAAVPGGSRIWPQLAPSGCCQAQPSLPITRRTSTNERRSSCCSSA